MKKFGLWCEYTCVPTDICALMPEGMTYEEAAAIPVNYITAYQMLFCLGGLQKGQSVLVQMAAGIVSVMTCHMLRSMLNVP